MASTNFVDYVKIFCRSGAGGPGSMHLHRDKRSAKGGPDGGNGGRGGHVILKGNRNYWTLIHLKFQRHVYAEISSELTFFASGIFTPISPAASRS